MDEQLDVRALRTRLRMTQAELGSVVGVDQSTVSNWETGTEPRGPAKKLLRELGSRSNADEVAS